jgi:hypothetical protein
MIRLDEKGFLILYYSGVEIVKEAYSPDGVAYLWNKNAFDSGKDEYIYIVSPKSKYDYLNFVANLEKTKPLLVELK